MAEWFNGAEEIFNVFFQISIGYVVSFIFYIMQIYVPSIEKNKQISHQITTKINYIVTMTYRMFEDLSNIYFQDDCNKTFNEKNLKIIQSKLSFNDKSKIIDISTSNNMKVGDVITAHYITMKNEIDELYKYYMPYLNVETSDAIERIKQTVYFKSMPLYLKNPKITFDENCDLLLKFHKSIVSLEDIAKKIKKSDELL